MSMLIILTVSLATIAIPTIIKLARFWLPFKFHRATWLLPALASTLFFISFYLPNIHISSETSTFQQHFVGGGIYCALLYLYAKQLFAWNFHWLVDLILLFAWTSTLGVANKLMEFALLKLHFLALDTTDAYWDLLANTLGAYFGFVTAVVISLVISLGSKAATEKRQ